MDQILFLVFAAQAVVSALLSVTRKNTVSAACWLVLMFFALAGVYALMEAWFVAAIQILVYAGAIMVLFLFVIMLMDLRSTELASHRGPKMRVLGIVLSLAFLATVVYAIHHAATHDDVVAERVTTVLHLPAPPPKPSEDPTQPEQVLEAPPPQSVALRREPGGWRGEFLVDGRSRGIEVDLGSGPGTIGTVSIADVDGFYGEQGTDASGRVVAVRGFPEGTAVDVVVQQGGLAAHAGGGPDGSARAMGKGLFEEWLLPFEIVSLLLTGAIFGTVVLTKRRLA
jgi:NADH:ubiquinone oxidoreductase subunit 6 (subunit J)